MTIITRGLINGLLVTYGLGGSTAPILSNMEIITQGMLDPPIITQGYTGLLPTTVIGGVTLGSLIVAGFATAGPGTGIITYADPRQAVIISPDTDPMSIDPRQAVVLSADI